MKELIDRLRLGASISRDRNLNMDYAELADKAATVIESLMKERDELLAKAERIEFERQGWMDTIIRITEVAASCKTQAESAEAALAELEKQEEPLGYIENGRVSISIDGGPDMWRTRKSYCGPIYARPVPAIPALNHTAEWVRDEREWLKSSSPAIPEGMVLVPRKTRAEFLDLALNSGAVLTGKPNGSEAITVVFSMQAWRDFAVMAQAAQKGE